MEANQLKQALLDKLISIGDKDLLEQVNQLIGDVDLEKKHVRLVQNNVKCSVVVKPTLTMAIL
ncbi:MAG: hypothetical protein JWQ09_5929 [Segetibacter sp.]|nr:hypothetical protein [Segetibacter sp.]